MCYRLHMTNRVRKTATPLDEWVGARIREIREKRHITQGDFADRMKERIKKGWTRQVVWQVERGEKPLSTRELMHIADVLAVTVVDLISSSEHVEIDGVERRTDDLVSGESAMPEVEGWARFDDAVAALRDCALAWARYQNAVDAVRSRVRDSERLREDIERYGANERARLRDEIEEAFSSRPPEGFDVDAYMRLNPSPDVTAAHDVLRDAEGSAASWLHPYPWAARPKQERKNR